jgi:hypothetical protein
MRILSRFERGPIVEPKAYWDQLEWRRTTTYRHLALEHAGAAGHVNECVITRAHDRSLPLRIRMFLKENANKKSFSNSNNNQESKEPASSWEQPKSNIDIIAAINNFAEVYAALWPLDPSARIVLRVLTHYEFGACLAGGEKERVKAVEEFCDALLRENARRAILQEPPISCQQAKERWRDFVELRKTGSASGGGAGGQVGANAGHKRAWANAGGDGAQSGGAQAAGAGTSGGGRAGSMARSAVARFNGDLVCFHFNSAKGCNRGGKLGGCANKAGTTYAHVCNFEFSPNNFCFARHTRKTV